MKITALLAAGALALCAAPTTEARLGRRGRSLNRVRYDQDDDLGRWGGWNGAAAQAAAMAISGFSGGTLNGPSSGGYSPGLRNYNAPIVRLAYDEDDLGAVYGRSRCRHSDGAPNPRFRLSDLRQIGGDEDEEDLLGC